MHRFEFVLDAALMEGRRVEEVWGFLLEFGVTQLFFEVAEVLEKVLEDSF